MYVLFADRPVVGPRRREDGDIGSFRQQVAKWFMHAFAAPHVSCDAVVADIPYDSFHTRVIVVADCMDPQATQRCPRLTPRVLFGSA